MSAIRHGGNGDRTRMICGFLGGAGVERNPVISTLPPLFKLAVAQAGAAEWIRATFQYAAEQVAAGHPGSQTVLAKLSELLFVEAVRRYAETLPDDQTGWLAGLRDPQVARAPHAAARRHQAGLDGRRAGTRGRHLAFGPGR